MVGEPFPPLSMRAGCDRRRSLHGRNTRVCRQPPLRAPFIKVLNHPKATTAAATLHTHLSAVALSATLPLQLLLRPLNTRSLAQAVEAQSLLIHFFSTPSSGATHRSRRVSRTPIAAPAAAAARHCGSSCRGGSCCWCSCGCRCYFSFLLLLFSSSFPILR